MSLLIEANSVERIAGSEKLLMSNGTEFMFTFYLSTLSILSSSHTWVLCRFPLAEGRQQQPKLKGSYNIRDLSEDTLDLSAPWDRSSKRHM